MDEILSGSGPAILIIAVLMGLAGFALIIRRRLQGKTGAAVTAKSKREEQVRKIEKQALAAVAPPTRRLVHPEAVGEAIPDFDLLRFQLWATDLFTAVQHARTGDRAAVTADLLPGALEVALAGGIGLKSTETVRIRSVQVVKANGTVDGCDVRLVFTALISEVRDTGPALTLACEEWRFGWAPATHRWRVVQVERRWRRLLEPALLHVEGHEPARLAIPAPDLDQAMEALGIDFDAVEACTRLAVEAWAAALAASNADLTQGLATDGFRDGILADLHRHRAFDMAIQWSVRVDTVAPARAMSDGTHTWVAVRVVGEQAIALIGPGESRKEASGLPWARYLELVSGEPGQWLLQTEIEDDHWVV